jgi:hypothetical protein
VRALISTQEFNSSVVQGDLFEEEIIADCLTVNTALVFAAAEDLQGAVRGFLEAKTAGEGHRAMVAMRAALAKSEGKTDLIEY